MTLKMFFWHLKRGNKQVAYRILGLGYNIVCGKLFMDKLNCMFLTIDFKIRTLLIPEASYLSFPEQFQGLPFRSNFL